jgi:hypothetical protein
MMQLEYLLRVLFSRAILFATARFDALLRENFTDG